MLKFSINSFIYRHFIDRILSGAQKYIISNLKASDRVLDVACGTGSLSMSMAEVAQSVTGIDLSEELIELARSTAAKRDISNVLFKVQDASDLSSFSADSLDLAVTSMAIHQFDPDLAIAILKEMKRIAGKVIIMDYSYPLGSATSKSIIYLIEWIAGGDHYSNFLKYNKLGGLDYYLSGAGLKLNSVLKSTSAFRVVYCS